MFARNHSARKGSPIRYAPGPSSEHDLVVGQRVEGALWTLEAPGRPWRTRNSALVAEARGSAASAWSTARCTRDALVPDQREVRVLGP